VAARENGTTLKEVGDLELILFDLMANSKINESSRLAAPADTPAGRFSITVADGKEIQQNSAIQQFVPRSLADLIGTINKMKLADRLYLQTFRTTNGAIIGSSEMPNLPPSVLATLNNDRTAGGIKPALQTIVNELALAPAEFLISGEQTLTIEVIK
jgi:hypothetical protein